MSDPFAPISPSEPPVDPFTPAPVVVTKPVKRQGRSGSLLLAVAGVVAVFGIAFAAGRLTAPAAAAAGGTGGNGSGGFGNFPGGSFSPGGGFPGRGNVGGPGGFGALRAIDLQGQVTAVTPTSITIHVDNGTGTATDVTIPLDSQTTYHQATSGSVSDVTVCSTVTVQPGAANFAPGASPNPQASGAPG